MANETSADQGTIRKLLMKRMHYPAAVEVKSYDYKISSHPLYSDDLKNCNGVALMNGSTVGLLHCDLDYEVLDEPLQRMIAEMYKRGKEDLKAILIGGDAEHFGLNMEILKRNNIPVVSHYCDGHLRKKGEEWDTKSLIVVPSIREIIMYGDSAGFRRLYPLPKLN